MIRKYSFFLLSLYLFAMPAVAYEPIPPEINTYIEEHLQDYQVFFGKLGFFSEDSRQALLGAENYTIGNGFYDPEPWSVNIDINGDDKIDWVGYLLSKQHEGGIKERRTKVLYCICSSENGYQPYTPIGIRYASLWSGEPGDPFYPGPSVYRGPPGEYRTNIINKTVTIKTDIVVLGFLAEMRSILYWDGEAFQHITWDRD